MALEAQDIFIHKQHMEIINNSSKLVKPATPTPSNLRNYNVSFFDEQMPNISMPLILYYSPSQNDFHADIFNHLETSLSKTLTDFYPLAGRYMRDGSFIDCSDQGALYVQATANFQLSEFLGLAWELKYNMLNDLLPCEIGEAGEVDDPMLYIKVTTFECGGFAIGTCSTHKFCDMSTMCTFISNWAIRSQASSNIALELEKYYPIFTVPRDFPKRELNDLSPRLPRTSIGVTPAQIFLFKEKAISKLREKVIFKDDKGRRPSKLQLVVALLWKTFVGIDKANNNGQSKVSSVAQGVNLRDKAVPKLPDNLCGNFVSVAIAQTDTCEGDNIDLQGFYMILQDGLKKYDSSYAKALASCEYDVLVKPFLENSQYMTNGDVNFYSVTSWCKFSSFNNADFGWGKPVWKSTGQFTAQNFVVMMDNQEGDGIEAWVYLDEKRMHQLEEDPDIKVYANYTPSQ